MNEPTPSPLIDIPALKGEPLRAKVFRYFRHHWGRVTAIGAVVAAVIGISGHILGGIAGYWEFYRIAWAQHGKSPSTTSASALAERPFRSVAVLPVTSDSQSETERVLAGNLTQELTAVVGRAIPEGLVVWSGLAQQYASAPRDPRKIGQELNVRYLVEASVNRSTAAHEITIELIDSADGARAWTDRQPIDASGNVAEALGKTGNGLRNALVNAARKEAASFPEAKRQAFALLFRAGDLGMSLAANREKQQLYEEALRLDPAFVPALLNLAYTLHVRAQSEPERRAELVAQMDDVTLRATRAAPSDPRAWVHRGVALRYQGNWSGAFAASDAALRIDPFRSHTVTQRAALLIYAGRAAEALPVTDQALQLDPSDQSDAMIFRCYAYLQLGRNAEAVAPCETAAARTPTWGRFMLVTAAYANLGDTDKAIQWRRRLMEANPRISMERVQAIMRVSDNAQFVAQWERWITGLRKAGVPEK